MEAGLCIRKWPVALRSLVRLSQLKILMTGQRSVFMARGSVELASWHVFSLAASTGI